MYCLVGGIIDKTAALVELAYWDGVKDGGTLVAVALIILYLVTHHEQK